jgi:hypothetical protein
MRPITTNTATRDGSDICSLDMAFVLKCVPCCQSIVVLVRRMKWLRWVACAEYREWTMPSEQQYVFNATAFADSAAIMIAQKKPNLMNQAQ